MRMNVERIMSLACGVLFFWTILLKSCKASDVNNTSSLYHDYCVIGAGPGGLQLGYFLKRAGRDYMLFEKSNIPGNFFVTYPRHRQLISINRRNTGQLNKGFTFRHDWNSLISDDESLLLKHYSKDLFPHADVLVKYLKDYQEKLGINVQFDTEISNIRSEDNDTAPKRRVFLMDDQRGRTYRCRTVVVATGMWKPKPLTFPGAEHVQGYESISINPEDYEGKKVLILGRGNSAFETAASMSSHASYVHLLGRSPYLSHAWDSHYVGDVRAVNNNLLDTYLLKSLDGVLFMDGKEWNLQKMDGKFFMRKGEHYCSRDGIYNGRLGDNYPMREGYDIVIGCLGFTFDDSIFNNSDITRAKEKAEKYPAITPAYESVDMPGLFVAGTASHSLDFKKSAGGFIHGFRYTAQALHNLLEWRYEGVKWPSVTVPLNHLQNLILKRLNEGSGTYQMFGVLGDVAIIDRKKDTATYLEEFPIRLLSNLTAVSGHEAQEVIVIILNYGPKGVDPEDRFNGLASQAHLSFFLHPIFYYYQHLPTELDFELKDEKDPLPTPDSMHQMVEDFLILFDTMNQHHRPLRRWLEVILSRSLVHHFSEDCMEMALTQSSIPPFCQENYLQGQGLLGAQELHFIENRRGVIMASLY